jgi:ubiquinone/menaquinone biosynthesis C-methylase UbiE
VRTANFDSVARIYRWLEYAVFGPLLERARFTHLGRLADRREILLLGDGDGRALQRLLVAAPSSQIVSVDASKAMLALAAGRVPLADQHRVTFVHADARMLDLQAGAHDAVVTQFFLDCFTASELAPLVERIAHATDRGSVWVYTDFAIPERGIRRVVARVIIAALYRFFRWRTALSARELPPSEQVIGNAGFRPIEEATFAGGLLRSVVFQKGAP